MNYSFHDTLSVLRVNVVVVSSKERKELNSVNLEQMQKKGLYL